VRSSAAPFLRLPTGVFLSGKPKRVLPFGDSITYGTGSTDGGGYRTWLQACAAQDGKAIQFVGTQASGPSAFAGLGLNPANEGHPGYTIANTPVPQSGITELVSTVIPATTPDIVLLHIGVNDVNYTAGLATMLTRLDTLLGSLVTAAPSTWIIVAQNTPYNFTSPEFATYIAGIPGLVATRVGGGQKLRSCNMQTLFLSDLADSVHPNDSGYSKMGAIWYAAIKDLL